MKGLITILNSVFFQFFWLCAIAQPDKEASAHEEILGVNNGLSQGFVTCIQRDKQGLIWIGTKYGLNRWDGYRFRVFKNEIFDSLSLPDNYVTQMVSDSSGNLWIGTESQGIVYFDMTSGKFFSMNHLQKKQLPTNYIVQMQYTDSLLMVLYQDEMHIYDVSDFENRIHVLGHDANPKALSGGIKLVYNYNHDKPQDFPELIPYNDFRFTLMPGKKVLFVYSDTLFFQQFSGSTDTGISYKLSLNSESKEVKRGKGFIYPIKGKSQCIVMKADRLSIFDIDRKDWVFSHALKKEEILTLERGYYNLDTYGNFYFPVKGNYIKFNPYSFILNYLGFNTTGYGFDLAARASCIDPDGYLWLGTGGFGVYKFNVNRKKFSNLPITGYPLATDRDGSLYFVTDFKLFKTIPTQNKFSQVPVVLKNHLGISIWAGQYGWDGKDTIWLTALSRTYSRPTILAYSIPRKEWSVANGLLPEGDLQFFNWGLYCNAMGDIWQWYRTKQGKPVLERHARRRGGWKQVFEFPDYFKNLGTRTIHGFYEDRFGKVWIASVFGLLSLNPSTGIWDFHSFNENRYGYKPLTKMLSVCPDPASPDTIIWVGTEGRGLFRFNKFTGKYTRYSMRDGLPNDVVYGILPDNRGNLWLSTNNGLCCLQLSTGIVRLFGVANGTAGQEFNRQQFYKFPDGRMVFGGVQGLSFFHPDSLLAIPRPNQKVVITNILINGKEYGFYSGGEIGRNPPIMPASLTIPYSTKVLAIEFALPYFTFSDQKQYRYKLEGFSDNWIYSHNTPFASFTNLFPGKYVFRVQARATTSDWLDESALLMIEVAPPWFLKWWFILLSGILLAALIYLIYRYRMQQHLKVLKLRNEIASDLHDEIGSTLSSITVYSDILVENVQSPALKQISQRISNSSQNILHSMSDIVWSINPKNDEFESIIIRMQSYANEILEAKKVGVDFIQDVASYNIKLSLIQRKNMYLIFKEALNNAIKYSKCSHIIIHIKYRQAQLFFLLKDNGIGFNVASPNEGNGLENMKRRAEDMGGTLKILSSPGMGTEVELIFSP